MSVVAVATVVVGAYSANEASKSARAAMSSQERMEADRLAFAQGQFDDYKEKYGDLEADMIADVENFTMRDNLDRYMNEGVVDVRSSFENQKMMANRDKARYGIDPGDARFQDTGLDLEQTKAEIGVKSAARGKAEEERIQDEDKLFSRRLAVSNFGKKSMPGIDQITGAMNSSADMYGKQASGYADEAAAGYGMVGKGINKMGQKDWSAYGNDNFVDTSGTPDYGDGMMTDDYGSFSSGDLGW